MNAAGHLGAAREPQPLLDGDRELVDARGRSETIMRRGRRSGPRTRLEEAIIPDPLRTMLRIEKSMSAIARKPYTPNSAPCEWMGRRVEPCA